MKKIILFLLLFCNIAFADSFNNFSQQLGISTPTYTPQKVPYFLATNITNTALFQNAYYVLTVGTAIDNMGWFDLTGAVQQYAYIPQRAGYYWFHTNNCVTCTTNFTYIDADLMKNGQRIADNDIMTGGTATFGAAAICTNVGTLTYMNGSTDYVQAFAYVKGTGCQFSFLPYDTFFDGWFVSP